MKVEKVLRLPKNPTEINNVIEVDLASINSLPCKAKRIPNANEATRLTNKVTNSLLESLC